MLTTTREKYIYIINKVKDTFVLRCNLLNILGGSIVLNELLVDEKGNFWLAMDKGLYCLSASADGKEIVREKAKGRFILKDTYLIISSLLVRDS